LGGLARKATILDSLAQNTENILVVDAGNLFFKKDIIDPGIETEVSKEYAKIILESFNIIGCTVFSPGKKDFAAGKDFLLNLYEDANFPFISANIYENDKPLFSQYHIEEINGIKIAFIGLISNYNIPGITIENPIESLKKLLNSNQINADLTVLLFNSNQEDIRKLYAENLDIDLIIRSNDTKRSPDGGNKIPTYSLGDRGKVLFSFDINIELLPVSDLVDIDWCNNTITRTETRLDKMRKGNMLVDLEEIYKNDPATLKRIEKYKNLINEASEKLDNAINTISLTKIELGKKINGRLDILQIVDEGKRIIQDLSGPNLPDHKGRLPGDPHYQHGH